jgi:polynucleotide 5'-kinase involved in rRNA processing
MIIFLLGLTGYLFYVNYRYDIIVLLIMIMLYTLKNNMDNVKMKEKISINLKPFDMNWITDDKVIVLIGKRNTGKSVLVKDLLYYH